MNNIHLFSFVIVDRGQLPTDNCAKLCEFINIDEW